VSLPSIVLIGPVDALPALRERVDSGAELHTFTDSQALEALDHILRSKPRIVALDQEFSATSRGMALITRIKDDPSLNHCEIRVIAHDSALSRINTRRAPATTAHGGSVVAIDEPKPALDRRGTRRAARVRLKDGVEVLVDGNSASLVDLSAVGAQVLCATVLRPNQRVRMSLNDAKGAIRCSGSIAWAALELPKGLAPRYRAGVDLTGADADAIKSFAERHRKA
jgi:hypothetical protein